MKLAPVYCRISSSGQEQGTSLKNQIAKSISAARRKGYSVLPEYVEIERSTGPVPDGPGLDRV